jgi:hypothetical protein
MSFGFKHVRIAANEDFMKTLVKIKPQIPNQFNASICTKA